MARLMRRRCGGWTLVELMVAAVILGVILLASIGVYVAAQRFFNDLVRRDNRVVQPAFVLETILRRARVANTFTVDLGNDQLNLRVDPNGTPDNLGDDTWFKYRVVGQRMRWTSVDANPDGSDPGDIVNGADPEIETGLIFLAGTVFSTENPSTVGFDTVIHITMVTESGSPPTPNTRLEASIAPTGMAKR